MMNTQEILDGQNLLKEKELSEEAQQDLKRAATWARFISITLYFCFSLIVLVIFLLFFYIGTSVKVFEIVVLYLILGVIIFFMAQYLMRFNNQLMGAFMQQSASLMHGAFRNLRLYMQLCFLASICWLLYSLLSLATLFR